MADLLECILQIKGLRETVDRLSALVANVGADRWDARPEGGQPTATELLSTLAEIEVLNGASLRLMLTSDRPVLPYIDETALERINPRRRWSPGDAFSHFLGRRSDNLELLDHCTADDMSRKGAHPVRREIILADLVAVMLATDVEYFGEIKRALAR